MTLSASGEHFVGRDPVEISEFVEGALTRKGYRDPGLALSRFQYPSNLELGNLASSLVPQAQGDGESEHGQKALKD